MKLYNFKKVKSFIEKNKDLLKEVQLGMLEDWFWTSQTVWENDKYVISLKKGTEIAGINGSYWATPICNVTYKTGKQRKFDCFTGESTERSNQFIEADGPLSGMAQNYINEIKELEI